MGIPPLPPALLDQHSFHSHDVQSTPHFNGLYRELTAQILDSDAETKALKLAFARRGVDERLKEERVRRAREAVLVRGTREVCCSVGGEGLDGGLRELGLLVARVLALRGDGGENEELEGLMEEEMDEFRARMDEFAVVLGRYLDGLDGLVADMAGLLDSSSTAMDSVGDRASRIPSSTTIPTSTTRRQHIVRNQQTSSPTSYSILQKHLSNDTQQPALLPVYLSKISSSLSALLALQSTLLTTRISHLETHTHSRQSRHLTTHSSFLSTVSTGIFLKASILSLLKEKEIYAQEGMRPALTKRFEALQREERELGEREDGLRDLLAEFEGVGEKAMRELGREYAVVLSEVEVLKGDLERLSKREGR